jgi:hypothetical protein
VRELPAARFAWWSQRCPHYHRGATGAIRLAGEAKTGPGSNQEAAPIPLVAAARWAAD